MPAPAQFQRHHRSHVIVIIVINDDRLRADLRSVQNGFRIDDHVRINGIEPKIAMAPDRIRSPARAGCDQDMIHF